MYSSRLCARVSFEQGKGESLKVPAGGLVLEEERKSKERLGCLLKRREGLVQVEACVWVEVFFRSKQAELVFRSK